MARVAAGDETGAESIPGQGDWANTPERASLPALRFASWIALTFGRRATRCLLPFVSFYFLLFSPTQRRHIKRYLLRTIGPQMNWRDGYRLIHAFAATVLDRLYFLRGRMDLFEVRMRGVERLDAELAAARGAFMLGAHVGSFEALGACRQHSADIGQLRLAMLMYPDNARYINAVLDAISLPALRPHLIALGRTHAMLELRDWLDGGGMAGMLADRTLPEETGGQRGNGVAIDFLGAPAIFNDGPFRLAALLRRKVFFMAGIYLGDNRYEVSFEPLADFSQRPATPAERERQIRAALEAYVARLATLCRAHPYNWFNFHDFWLEDR